jgi:enoyl-CoA hydratase/carnithine racemase
MMKFESLEYSVTGSTATVRLNRPEARNAFTTGLYAELRDAVRLSERDPQVRCVVVTGTKGAFAAGGDLKEMLGYLNPTDGQGGDDPADDEGPLGVYRFEDSLPFMTMRSSAKPIIAAVNGICVGGGCTTIASCDIVIAAESARFGIPEARVGLVDAYLPAFLYGQVSLPVLKYLCYTGQLIDARHAERIGLITEVVPDDQLDERVTEVAAELAATDDAAKAQYKLMFSRMVPETSMRDVYPLMFSADVREKLIAFSRSSRAR